MEKIYTMELHETITIGVRSYVTRVPGGWKYEDVSMSGVIATTFVPYHVEFFTS
jgi:hypothetical protein